MSHTDFQALDIDQLRAALARVEAFADKLEQPGINGSDSPVGRTFATEIRNAIAGTP